MQWKNFVQARGLIVVLMSTALAPGPGGCWFEFGAEFLALSERFSMDH